MRLIVADLDHSVDIMEAEIDNVDGFDGNAAAVLYVSVPAASRSRQVDNEIAALPPEALRNSMTVVRLHPWCDDALDEDDLQDIWARVGRVPLYFLEYEHKSQQPSLRHVLGDRIDGLDTAALIESIRSNELRSVLFAAGALLPSHPRLHYEGPNGHHYAAFLRPGFALTSNDRLDRVSFWLLPHVRGRRTVVVDHWSMLALAHHAAAYAERADQAVAIRRPKVGGEPDELFVEALRGYEAVDDVSQRLRGVLPYPSKNAALFLLSINSTGTLAHDVVLPGLQGAQQTGAHVAALASACPEPDRDVAALLRLDDEFQRHPAQHCADCSGDKTILPIAADTLLMKLSAYTARTAIKGTDAAHAKTVIERYEGRGVFSLHRDHNDSGHIRHHAFHVDVSKMLEAEVFKDRLNSELDKLAASFTAGIVVCPPTAAASALGATVAGQLGIPLLQIDQVDLSRIDDEQRDLLIAEDKILLVDDVVITGSRVLGYRHAITALKRAHSPAGGFEMACLVGVARPVSTRRLRGIRDYVHHHPTQPRFAAVEELLLPNWDAKKCPWCLELEHLEQDSVQDLLIGSVQRRLEALRTNTGLYEPYFATGSEVAQAGAEERRDEHAKRQPDSLTETHATTDHTHGLQDRQQSQPDGPPSSNAAPSPSEKWQATAEENDATRGYADRFWELGPASVFGAAQGADLMMSIAASVQALRCGDDPADPEPPRLDDSFRPPISKVLDPALYLSGRFYEPIIVACILRASNTWDLRTPDSEDDLSVALTAYLSTTAGQGLLGEAIVQAAAGRLPAQPVLQFIEANDSLNPLAQALLSQ